jgi:crossover junction endodeoxyribonuclease RuvC
MSSARWLRRYSLRPRGRDKGEAAGSCGDWLRVIGIDPGSYVCGYGIIEPALKSSAQHASGNRFRNPSDSYSYIASGRIMLSPRTPLHLRLKEIHDGLVGIIDQYHPHVAVVERIFFAKGVKSALNLGHARGISLFAVTSQGLPVYEYSATEVKRAVVGYGRAEKLQVQKMVRIILNIEAALSPDSADALALSICHINTLRFQESDRDVSR